MPLTAWPPQALNMLTAFRTDIGVKITEDIRKKKSEY